MSSEVWTEKIVYITCNRYTMWLIYKKRKIKQPFVTTFITIRDAIYHNFRLLFLRWRKKLLLYFLNYKTKYVFYFIKNHDK